MPNPRLGPSGLKLILRSPETTNFFSTFVDFFPLQTATKIRLFREAYKKHDKLMKDAVNGQGTFTFYRKTTKIATSDNNSVPPPPPPKKTSSCGSMLAIDLECFDPRMLLFLVIDQELKGRN